MQKHSHPEGKGSNEEYSAEDELPGACVGLELRERLTERGAVQRFLLLTT